jgi:hypothetical protein
MATVVFGVSTFQWQRCSGDAHKLCAKCHAMHATVRSVVLMSGEIKERKTN